MVSRQRRYPSRSPPDRFHGRFRTIEPFRAIEPCDFSPAAARGPQAANPPRYRVNSRRAYRFPGSDDTIASAASTRSARRPAPPLTRRGVRLSIGFRRICAGVRNGLPIAAASGASPLVDNSCWQIGRADWSCDHVSAGAGIGPLRRRAMRLVADHPGGPAAFKAALKMQWIDDGVHGAPPVIGGSATMSLRLFAVICGTTDMVS